MNEQDILEELKFQADLHDDRDDSEYSVFFIRCIGEIRGLREQLAATESKIRWIEQGPESIVGFPWDAPYQDGYEAAKTELTTQIIDLEEQLAARDAVIVKLREALKDATIEIECTSGTDMSCDPKADCSNFYAALALPNDDSALQEALKQAKRKALLDAAKDAEDHIDYPLDFNDEIQNEKLAFMATHCRRMAEEIK